MALDNGSLSELRQVALDPAVTPRTRLSAIDSIASATNQYGTFVHPITSYVEPTTRGKKFLFKALRKLRKTKRPMPKRLMSSINQRLLLLKGYALDINNPYLTPPLGPDGRPVDLSPPKIEPQPVEQKPVVKDAKLLELEAFLAEHAWEGNNDKAITR